VICRRAYAASMEWRPGYCLMPDNVHFILSADQKEALRLTLGEKSGVVAGRNFSDAIYFKIQNL
jgi:hypothetical protein